VVNGVFSPLDTSPVTQEEQVKKILQRHIPGVDVVCSRDIGRVGYLERENAAILNAAILAFGRVTIGRFQKSIEALGIDCPLYLTQNDGTVLDARAASLAPIRTFSSGATNSLIGALFLSGIHDLGSSDQVNLAESQVIMCDIGGTTSDFAALSPSGLPRQSPATVKIGGVRTAFSMPEVLSIGLGGGSVVQTTDPGDGDVVTVGPLSVGYKLPEESQCFGGSTLTATDIVVASGHGNRVGLNVLSKLQDVVPQSVVEAARRNIRRQLEHGIDIMKTSDRPVVLLLVGGGSIILTDDLHNVQRCLRPEFADVANAVGAAIAKVSIPLRRSKSFLADLRARSPETSTASSFRGRRHIKRSRRISAPEPGKWPSSTGPRQARWKFWNWNWFRSNTPTMELSGSLPKR
jgi:hypothetical protein